MRKADIIKNYDGQNPFFDSQARNFSDEKVLKEFCPISSFWDLFNEQHEIILGTRGSGKTFLLKMMRYSMLKRIDAEDAKRLVLEKRFFSFYVPMHLEFVTSVAPNSISSERRIEAFQIAFNFILAQSMIQELHALTGDIADPIEKASKIAKLSYEISSVWFDTGEGTIFDFLPLERKLNSLFNNFDPLSPDNTNIPIVFRKQICSPLVAAKDIITSVLGITSNPTWLVCIDEAEFLDQTLQECINNVFRSDSNRIALKVATLPYAHTTLKTFSPDVTVSAGNDFIYHVIDMEYDSADFLNLTNRLCSHRINSRVDPSLNISTLEDFLGKIGNDDLIDYYRKEIGEKNADREQIEERIVQSFSPKRMVGSSSYKNKRKTIYDKYATIFFTREMYRLSKQGNRKPGWYAGAKTVRKVSQGNPRAFLRIMNELFEEAKKHPLQPKMQHQVLLSYANNFCLATKGLNEVGPVISSKLEFISEYLRSRVHDRFLISAGASFVISFANENDFSENKEWIQAAIANSRLIVADGFVINGITKDTKYLLSNAYCAAFWIPMRSDIPAKISFGDEGVDPSYKVQTKKRIQNCPEKNAMDNMQISIFDEVRDENS